VAFFYYSGHGAADRTNRGENYLIPVGARITLAKQLPILGVSLSEITKALDGVSAKARFVVVDACRNVAFTKGIKDVAKGLIPERKRAIAQQAEAERGRRAKVIQAEGEFQAAEQFLHAAQILAKAPEAMHLRYLTTLNTIASDKQSTIVFPFPLELMRVFSPPDKGSP
jgi:regulator of protease activity HflC (stomatin/prohibitin superfamily)